MIIAPPPPPPPLTVHARVGVWVCLWATQPTHHSRPLADLVTSMLNIDPAARPEMDDVDDRARAALAHQVAFCLSLPPSSSPRNAPASYSPTIFMQCRGKARPAHIPQFPSTDFRST